MPPFLAAALLYLQTSPDAMSSVRRGQEAPLFLPRVLDPEHPFYSIKQIQAWTTTLDPHTRQFPAQFSATLTAPFQPQQPMPLDSAHLPELIVDYRPRDWPTFEELDRLATGESKPRGNVTRSSKQLDTRMVKAWGHGNPACYLSRPSLSPLSFSEV